MSAPGDDLGRALLSSVCHDLGSPLSSLTSNVTLAKEMLAESGRQVVDSESRGELAEMLEEMSMALGRIVTMLTDLRALVDPRRSDEAIAVGPDVAAALRLARHSISRARSSAVVGALSDVRMSLSHAALVGGVAQTLIALAQNSAPGGKLSIEPARGGIALVARPAVPDRDALTRQLTSVSHILEESAGRMELEEDAASTRVVLFGSSGDARARE